MGYSFNGLVFIERISITLTHRNFIYETPSLN